MSGDFRENFGIRCTSFTKKDLWREDLGRSCIRFDSVTCLRWDPEKSDKIQWDKGPRS